MSNSLCLVSVIIIIIINVKQSVIILLCEKEQKTNRMKFYRIMPLQPRVPLYPELSEGMPLLSGFVLEIAFTQIFPKRANIGQK